MSSILEGADIAYLREYNESEDERRLGALEDSLGSIRKATKGGKYLGSDVIDIMVQVQGFAEKLGIDPDELEYAENQVREAMNNLESAIYGLEEPFEDAIRTLQNRIDDARMDAEDDLEEGQRLDPNCWKGYKKQGTKMKGGIRVNNCVKATESEEVDEGMYDQDAFDAIFKDKKDRGSMKMPKNAPQDTGMYNQPAKRSPKYYDNHPTKRSPQHYDKGPETDQKLKETPKYIDGFIGADGKPTSQPTAADYAANKEFQHMKKTLGDRLPQPTKRDKDGKLSPFKKDDVDEGLAGAASGAYLGSKIAGLPGAVAGGVLGHQATKEGKKSSIGKVMEMYDDYLFLIYINGKLAADTPIAKNQKNQYERVIKNAIPDAEVIFKPTPAHYYTDEELAEGSGKIRAGIAGILLLGGLLGLNNHEAQKVYDKSHQLQQLTQVYMVAKDRGDEAKMKDVKRRIGNHKMRLDLGKGDVDFDGRPGKDDIKDIDYINTPGEK